MAEILPAVVYFLCFATSAACAWLLARNYRRSRAPLLLWSALCFLFLALNNLVLIFDRMIMPDVSFSTLRVALSLIAVSLLLFGLIWDREEER